MNEFILTDESTGKTKHFDTKAEAEDHKQEMSGLVDGPLTISHVDDTGDEPEQETAPDGGQAQTAEPVKPNTQVEDLPDEQPGVDTDPLDWVPSDFVDEIDGTQAINRKGFEVLAHHYNVSCETDLVDYTDERVIHKARATTEDGVVYTAYGEAHSSEDTTHQLVRLSDTRAFKRAVSRATGIGMVAVEELQSEL